MKLIKLIFFIVISIILTIQNGNCKINDKLTDRVIMKNDEKKFPGLFKITNRNKRERIYDFDYRIIPPFKRLKINDLDMENPFLLKENVKIITKKKRRNFHVNSVKIHPKKRKIKIDYKKIKISKDTLKNLW